VTGRSALGADRERASSTGNGGHPGGDSSVTAVDETDDRLPPMRVSAYVAVLRSCRKPMGGSPHVRATTVRAEIEHRAEQHRQAMAGLQFERAEPLRGRTRLTQSTGGGWVRLPGAFSLTRRSPQVSRPDRWWPGTVGSISRRSPQVCTT
jgi:hypothetical protein